jgi:Transglycosylase SLT domain
MGAIKADTSVYALQRSRAEFQEPMWQYVNRRVSDWRIITGKRRAIEHAALIERIQKQYGVDRYLMLGLWGMESAFGDVVVNRKYMRPVLPALAALAWGEPRRRAYWEQELLNALVIIERGWADEEGMIGSWAGAMGHTQWMPEVWLNMGVRRQPRRQDRSLRIARRCHCRNGTLSPQAPRLSAQRKLGLRGPAAGQHHNVRHADHRCLAEAGCHPGQWATFPACRRTSAHLATGQQRPGVSDHTEFSGSEVVQSGRQLRASDRASCRSHSRRGRIRAAISWQ